MSEESTQSSGLFSVFILSIYSLVLIPYTIYYLCNTGDDTAQPIAKVALKDGCLRSSVAFTTSGYTHAEQEAERVCADSGNETAMHQE
jgi:hypothetical protein